MANQCSFHTDAVVGFDKEEENYSSVENQKVKWDALRKNIYRSVKWVYSKEFGKALQELFAENLIRGRGLFCGCLMEYQMASPLHTEGLAALAAAVNSKFPEVGHLLLRRILLQIKTAYAQNDNRQLSVALKFLAHLVNQKVVNANVALELLTLLLDKPTNDSVEQAFYFVKECGSRLRHRCPQGLHGILERFRGILHEGVIGQRVQFLIEGLMAITKANFQGCPAVCPVPDLVKQKDQLTHEISLLEEIDPEVSLDIFKPDPQFLKNEEHYKELKKTKIGEESDYEANLDTGSDNEDGEESDEEEAEKMKFKDETEMSKTLRRKIWLAVTCSVNCEEFGHELANMKLEPGQEALLEHLDCHDLQMLLTDPNMQESVEWMFPRDSPSNLLFCIKFFSILRLGNLTEHLKEYLDDNVRVKYI